MSKKLIYVFLFSLFWSLSIFFNKIALNLGADTLRFTILTTIITFALLSGYMVCVHRQQMARLKRDTLAVFFYLGIFVSTAYIAGSIGLRLSTSINYSFLIKSSLMFVIILAAVFLRESLTRQKIQLMVVFMLGTYLLTTSGQWIVPRLGDVLILGAGLCFAAATIIQKKLSDTLHPDTGAWGRLAGAFAIQIFILPFIGSSMPASVIPYLILVSVCNALLAVFLSRALTHGSANYLTMMSMMVPVFNTALGWMLLGESLAFVQVAGGMLILISGIIVHIYNI